jgi:hypothetical protein
MDNEERSLKNAWEKLEEGFVTQEKTAQQHLEPFRKTGGLEVGNKPHLLPPKSAISITKAARRRDVNTPSGVDNTNHALHEVDGSNPKYAEFDQAVIEGTKQAQVNSTEDGEKGEAPSFDSPGVDGWANVRNEILFPINVKLGSKEDLIAFKKYVFGYDEDKDELIKSEFEYIINEPKNYFNVDEIYTGEYGESYDGWTEFGIIRIKGKYYFKGVWESSSDDSGDFMNYEDWCERQEFYITQADKNPRADWTSKNPSEKAKASKMAGVAINKGKYKVPGEHSIGGKHQTYKQWGGGRSWKNGKPFSKIGKEITEAKLMSLYEKVYNLLEEFKK